MKSIANRIVSLTVGAKIAVIMALMMLPIGHLTLLFMKQVRKDVAFSSLEATGARLLTDVWGALAVSTAPGFSPERMSTAAQLVSAQQIGAASLNASDFSTAFARALSEGHERGKIWEAGQVAIQKIADGSNLTLDPDVDSYYVMDVVAVRLPELVIARALLDEAMQPALGGSGKLTARQYGILVQATTRYEIALGAVQSSLVSAIGGNADGSLATALATVRDRFTRAADLIAQQANTLREQHALERPLQLARSDAESAAIEFAAAADTLWRAGQAQLLRLIDTRIGGFESNAIRDLTIAALAALAAFVCALAFVRTIRNPISDLLKTMRRFQLNDFSEPVPHVALNNEIGEIARALDRGKHDAERSALTIAAMNQSPTMLMITDPEENITFISASLVDMLMQFEPTFREVRHDFAVEKMVGEHLDYYRANPNLSRKLLIDNGEVRKVRYDIADETVLVDMAYIFAADGSKIGHTLVWRNVTAELLGEAEIAAVVGAAQQGDFSARLPIENKEGFVREIANGLNNVSALVEKATGEFAEVMDAVAGADLTRSVTGHYQGVLGSLKNSINATVEHLASTVQTIQITSADVGLAAREINMGADDLSKRTEEQASSLEETAATTEQLAASVKATAQASRQAAATADEAMKVAQNGGAIANEAVHAMARIETASTKISAITRVIDDIAFQTNLLALNAAVEAARAGDAGKGFAVVASEVRTLAQRSSEAAKDISALIFSSNMEVGEGVKLVRRAGEALSQILGASQRVAGTIADISAASGEQANGIDEMSQAVAHLDEMTQANAALAEQSAASATSLSGRIEQLNDLVAAFKTRSQSDKSQAASEPARLRLLAEAAFMPRKGEVRRTTASAAPTVGMPVKKVANSRAGDAGWEEF